MVGPFEPWAVELMAAMSAAAQRPLNWNVLGVNARNLDEAEQKLEAGTYAREHGGRVVALTVPMSFPVYLSFRSGFVLDAMPGWEDVMGLPLDEKLAFFDDDAALAKLDEHAAERREPAAHAGQLERTSRSTTSWRPRTSSTAGRMVGEIAEAEGRSAWDVLTVIARADELNTSFGTVPAPETDDDWKARIEVWRDRRALIGASDAGAHLDLLASFNYATEVLGKAVRQRKLLPLEEAVNLLTDVPAQLYGLKERGRVAEGWKADVVVLDPETIGSHDVRMRMDLPGGAGRLYAEADGIEHVLVNGTGIVRDGKLTESRSGQLLRVRARHQHPVTRLTLSIRQKTVACEGQLTDARERPRSAVVSVLVAATRRSPAVRASAPSSGRPKPVSESTSVTWPVWSNTGALTTLTAYSRVGLELEGEELGVGRQLVGEAVEDGTRPTRRRRGG